MFMQKNKGNAKFGLIVCILGILLCGGLFALFSLYPKKLYPSLYTTIIPFTGVFLSLCVIFLGHTSYKRVQNLSVFASGYLFGQISLFYFVLWVNAFNLPLPPLDSPTAPEILIALFANLLLILLLPTQGTYRLARDITLTASIINIITLLVLRFGNHATDFTHAIGQPGFLSWPFYVCLGLVIVSSGLAFFRFKHGFHVGGVFSAVGFYLGLAWICMLTLKVDHSIVHLVFIGLMSAYCGGILVHLFARMEHKISYDPLLHIYNRNFCTRIITEQSSVNTLPPFTIAMVDIDHFKKVNDTYGHQAGDAVLHAVAQTVHNEIGNAGIVCRYGGEELAVFFSQYTTKEVVPLMENVRIAVEKTKTVCGKKTITVTISSGVSHREEKNQPIASVIEAADKALYKAKEGGRNQVKTGKTAAVTGSIKRLK